MLKQLGTLIGFAVVMLVVSLVITIVERYANVTDAAFVNLEKWFNSAQERAQQWFTLHTRLITVGAAFIAAFVLQLDTIALIKRLSTDADMRARLVAVAGSIQQQGSKALDETHRPANTPGRGHASRIVFLLPSKKLERG